VSRSGIQAVVVLEISGSQVRLGVAAPKDVKILRDGLLDDGDDFQWTMAEAAGKG